MKMKTTEIINFMKLIGLAESKRKGGIEYCTVGSEIREDKKTLKRISERLLVVITSQYREIFIRIIP